MLIALENGKYRQTEPLRLPRPAFTWLELSPEKGKAAPAYTWGPLNGIDTTSDHPNRIYGYPAFTLGLETTAKWPLDNAAPVGANVHLWWSKEEPRSVRKDRSSGATYSASGSWLQEVGDNGHVVATR